jgi:hypothetical protein
LNALSICICLRPIRIHPSLPPSLPLPHAVYSSHASCVVPSVTDDCGAVPGVTETAIDTLQNAIKGAPPLAIVGPGCDNSVLRPTVRARMIRYGQRVVSLHLQS